MQAIDVVLQQVQALAGTMQNLSFKAMQKANHRLWREVRLDFDAANEDINQAIRVLIDSSFRYKKHSPVSLQKVSFSSCAMSRGEQFVLQSLAKQNSAQIHLHGQLMQPCLHQAAAER